ncbi:MAG: hypothetical protein LLG05_09565 [Porphyromonadaceae bacterium]|nr:hypothetical protein [Porphyromonadaceae bacterium]
MNTNRVRSSIPQINRGPEGAGIKALFHSVRDIALIIDKTISGGYGYLKAGTVLAVNASSAGGVGKLVPYVPISSSVVLGEESAIGVAPIVQDCTSGHVFVSLEDSYLYEEGDDLILDNDDDEGPVVAAAITDIDRTTSSIYADITTTGFSHGNFTVAKKSYAYVKTYGSDPYTLAAYILDKDVDTGVGEDALGALSSVVVSNCVLYKNSLVNLTAAAITALGVVDGRFLIVK